MSAFFKKVSNLILGGKNTKKIFKTASSLVDTHCIWHPPVWSNMLNTDWYSLSAWARYECKAIFPLSPSDGYGLWQPSPLHQTVNTSSGESRRHTECSAQVSHGQHGLTRGQIRPLFSPSLWHWFAGCLTRLLFPSVFLFSNLETVPRSSSTLCLLGSLRSAWIVYSRLGVSVSSDNITFSSALRVAEHYVSVECLI